MKRRVVLLLLLIGTVLPVSGQENKRKEDIRQESQPADVKLPTVEEIIDGYIQALGGREAMEKHSSRVLKAAFEIPTMGLLSNAEVLAKSPNKWLLTIDIPSYGLVQQAYDGTSGWAQDPQAGLRDVLDGELSALRRSSEFNQPLKIRELYPSMTVKGRRKVGERDTYIVEATPDDGAPENMYFDAETHLLLRADVEADGPQGKVPFEVSFEDYKPVDGVLLAHTVTRTSPVITFVLRLEEIRHNVEIDDARFKKPEAVKQTP